MAAACPFLPRDVKFKRKVVYTCWLCVAFFISGWSMSDSGTTFLDLALITGANMDEASWLFTSGASGYLLGSFVGGVAFDRFNRQLVMSISLIGMGVLNTVIPLCEQLWLMCICTAVCGSFEGSIETGGDAIVVEVWGSKGKTPMLAAYFAQSAGGIVAPFVLLPFMAEDIRSSNSDSNSSLPTTSNDIRNVAESFNTTSTLTADNSPVSGLINSSAIESNLTLQLVNEQTESRVFYAYLMISLVSLATAVPFFIMFLRSRKEAHDTETDEESDINATRPEQLPTKLKMISLALVLLATFLLSAVEDCFNNFMMAFLVAHFDWGKSLGTKAISLYWACIAIGCFLGIFFAKYVKTSRLIYACICVLITSFAGWLVVSHTTYTQIVWGLVPLIGIALSPLLPAFLLWIEEKLLHVTGKISALLLAAGSLGSITSPLLFGYAMERNGPLWFVYLLLGLSLLGLIAYISAQCTVRLCIRPLLKTNPKDECTSTTIVESCHM